MQGPNNSDTTVSENSLVSPTILIVCLGTALKPGSGKKGAAPAAGAAAGAAATGKAEDSAHERDDNSESTVSEDSLNRMGGRQRSGSIEEIRHGPADHRADPQAAADKQRYLEKGKGKMPERRRTDSASSLRCAASQDPSHLVPGDCTCLPVGGGHLSHLLSGKEQSCAFPDAHSSFG